MLGITALRDAEYLISSVALGIDEYYLGVGEAHGVWQGRWAAGLGLEGVVEADDLRALVEGHHPGTGDDLLAGRPSRKAHAFDATYSCPKSVSLLWALGTDEVASIVVQAHVEAVATALAFLEEKAAFTRQQLGGVRRRVATEGFAVATFVHRTSREGDPQLHTHCLIPNVVERADGSHVAFNAHPLHEWAKASGSLFQSELQRLLSRDLGVAWGRERNGCREMEGFSREQLRTFSKRTLQIESELERRGEVYVSAADRMRADDQAALATRRPKDRQLTPALLRQAWEAEARTAGLDSPEQVERQVIERDPALVELSLDDVFAALVDPDIGLCAKESRFGEAHVYERVCALSQGRWRLDEVRRLVDAFLASPHAVRLVPSHDSWRQGRSWSTAEHRALEDHVLYRLEQLTGRSDEGVSSSHLDAALGRAPSLGDDQADAVRTLCAPGPALRSLVAPAGFGKTTAIHAAAMAHTASGRRVLGLATTNKAVAELRAVGLDAMTIARFRIETRDQALEPDALLIVDEVSQVSTRDAAVVLDSAVVTPGTRVWFLGDPRQTTPVAAGGIAAELARVGATGQIPAPELTENRRQVEEADREALVKLREGKPAESQTIRTDHGWEHECESAVETRNAMASAVAADVAVLGPDAVVALAVSHADCEDMADRIRRHLIDAGRVTANGIAGPGFGRGQRTYGVGDRVLLHAPYRGAGKRLHNGTVVTVVAANDEGLLVRTAGDGAALLPVTFVTGLRDDDTPNLSHAWARTIEGAQGGTWEAVHLLGTASLDALSGYVGQSRGRRPTHTWNTRPIPDVDHGGTLADDRDGTERVLAALAREPDTTFAAGDDPWPADRRLRAERDEHVRVLDRCPADRAGQSRHADDVLEAANWRYKSAELAVRQDEEALREVGPLQRVRASGRADHARAEARLAEARGVLVRCEAELTEAERRAGELEAHQASRTAFLARDGWRIQRIAAIDDELARHWAPVVLVAVRQDDPLAFGIERLRAARATYVDELDRLRRRLPPDRSSDLERARGESRTARRAVADAQTEVAAAGAAVTEAGQRHRGRRDRVAIDRAGNRAARADYELSSALDRDRKAKEVVAKVGEADRAHRKALRENGAALDALEESVADLRAALDRTRGERILAMLGDGAAPLHLTAVLGAVPDRLARRQLWCGFAFEVEAYRDVHLEPGCADAGPQAALGPRPERFEDAPAWDYLASRISLGPAIIAAAADLDAAFDAGAPDQWVQRVDQSVADHQRETTLERESTGLHL